MQKLFPYPGGKWPIRHIIIAAFPPHTTYVDLFGGSAAIIIAKEPSAGEVFNDKNEELVNFFRVVKHRRAELTELARYWIHSRLLFDEIKNSPLPQNEVERAFIFWVKHSDSFAGMGENFGTARKGVKSVTHARKYLDDVSERFAHVHIERFDFRKVIKLYDAAETFFYLDPPYPDTAGGKGNYDLLSEKDWIEMRDTLKSIKGKFLLSSNDHKMVRDLFKEFNTKVINVRVTLPREKKTSFRRELMISNYELPKQMKKAA